MSTHEQDIADRLERGADRMANAGFVDEERLYREAAAAIRGGLSVEEAEQLERRLLRRQTQRRRVSALAAAGEYDTGGDGGADQTGADWAVEPGRGIDETGAGDLLSTAFGSGLSDPFSPEAGGWTAASQDVDPFTGSAGGTADPFSALQSSDPYTQSFGQPDGANPYTSGTNIDSSTGSQGAESFTGGSATTDSPSQTEFSMAALVYAGQPTSLLDSPNLLAQNDSAKDPNVASDATSTGAVGQGALQVNGQSWAWTNFVQIGDTTYNVFSAPDGSMSALQPSGGGPIVFVDSEGNVTGAQSPSGGYVFPEVDVSGVAPSWSDFVPDPDEAKSTGSQNASQSQAAPTTTPAPDPPASPAPEAVSNPNTAPPPDASPQAAPSSSPPPSDPPDAPSTTAGDPNQASPGPPAPGTHPGISQEQREQEDWEAAKAGMWDTLVSMADTGMIAEGFHALGLPGLFDWAKAGPPTPTGDWRRDAQLLENYHSGGVVTTVVVLAAPIGAEGLLASAETAFTKLPALEGAGMMGGGRLIGPTEQWLSAFGEDAALGSQSGGALPGIADQVPTGPSFEGVINPAEFENDPAVIDRLSRARPFDIGGYKSMTGSGEFGRPGDLLDVDEALQNAYLRTQKGVPRVSAATSENPSMALPPELHSQIRNLRVPQMQGMTPEQVLQFHIDQMYNVAPDYAVRTLERESLRFIGQNF